MSKRWILTALMAFVVIGGSSAFVRADEEDEGKEVKIKFSEAPEVVQKTLTEEAHGQPIKTLDKETTKSGKIVYEADVKIDGTNYEIVVAADGKLIHKKIDEEENEKKGEGLSRWTGENRISGKREGEAPAEPGLSNGLRLGRSLALPHAAVDPCASC